MHNMGRRIREIRRSKNLTLRDVSHMTKLTEGLLSQVENSKVNPSITTLMAISRALNCPIGTLFDTGEQGNDNDPVVRRSERHVARTANGITYFLLTQHLEDKTIEVLFNEFQPGGDTAGESGELITHEGVECGIVLSGKLEVCIEEEVYVLNEGDSITFNSTRPHRIRNLSEQVSTAIWIDSPPTF